MMINYILSDKSVTIFTSITMLTSDIDIAILSVCLSVCLSRSGIVSKRLNMSSYFLQHVVAQSDRVIPYYYTTTTTTTTNVRIIVLPSHSCEGTLQNLDIKMLHSSAQTSADRQSQYIVPVFNRH